MVKLNQYQNKRFNMYLNWYNTFVEFVQCLYIQNTASLNGWICLAEILRKNKVPFEESPFTRRPCLRRLRAPETEISKTPYLPELVLQWKTSLLKRLSDVVPVVFDPNAQIHVFTVGNDATLSVPSCGREKRKRVTPANLILPLLLLKSLATHRTKHRKIMNFGTKKEDTMNINRGIFWVSISNTLAPPTAYIKLLLSWIT